MSFVRALLLSWAANAVVLFIVTLLIEDVTADGVISLLVAGAVFGLLNATVKPLLRLVTLPLAVITLGLIRFPIAMAILWLTTLLVDGFAVHGLWALFTATLVIWVVNLAMDALEPMILGRLTGRVSPRPL